MGNLLWRQLVVPKMADDIYSTVSLFLYYSQFFGLNPVILKKSKDGKKCFKPFWLGVLYTFGLAAFLMYSFQFSYGNIAMFADNDSDIMFMHTVCKLVFGPISNGIIFSSSMLSVRNLCEVINKLSAYDMVFQKHVATMKYKWIKWVFLLIFLISLGLCSAYFYNEDVVLRKVSERKLTLFEFVSFFMSWCLFDIISWTLILVVGSFMFLVFKKFQQINDKLMLVLADYGKKLDKDGDDTASIFSLTSANPRKRTPHIKLYADERRLPSKEVANIRYLHILLIRIAQDLNGIYATRLLTILALNVVLLCFSSFLLILMLVTGRRDSVLTTACIWVCVRFFPSCVLIAPFVLVTNEVSYW